jgi:hypothetical protein
MSGPPELIEGELTQLRRASPADASALFTAANHPDVVRFMEWKSPTDESETADHLEQAFEACGLSIYSPTSSI